MVNDTTKKSQISCFVTAEEYNQVKELAEKEDRSISNYARVHILKPIREGSS